MRRWHYILVALVVVLTLVLLNLPASAALRLKAGIANLFLPFLGLTSSARSASVMAVDRALPRSELIRLNEALARENQQLRIKAAQFQEIARENARLRQFVGWQQQRPWNLKLANVVLRDPANWWRTLQIDLGSRDGIRTNLPVVTPEGLVGRVSSVSLAHSQVVLIGDPNCRVAARVDNPAGSAGIVQGAGPLETQVADMVYLPRSAELKAGQMVMTSGEGGVFPKGLAVGRILESEPVEFGTALRARVRLAVNLNALEQVWVILP